MTASMTLLLAEHDSSQKELLLHQQDSVKEEDLLNMSPEDDDEDSIQMSVAEKVAELEERITNTPRRNVLPTRGGESALTLKLDSLPLVSSPLTCKLDHVRKKHILPLASSDDVTISTTTTVSSKKKKKKSKSSQEIGSIRRSKDASIRSRSADKTRSRSRSRSTSRKPKSERGTRSIEKKLKKNVRSSSTKRKPRSTGDICSAIQNSTVQDQPGPDRGIRTGRKKKPATGTSARPRKCQSSGDIQALISEERPTRGRKKLATSRPNKSKSSSSSILLQPRPVLHLGMGTDKSKPKSASNLMEHLDEATLETGGTRNTVRPVKSFDNKNNPTDSNKPKSFVFNGKETPLHDWDTDGEGTDEEDFTMDLRGDGIRRKDKEAEISAKRSPSANARRRFIRYIPRGGTRINSQASGSGDKASQSHRSFRQVDAGKNEEEFPAASSSRDLDTHRAGRISRHSNRTFSSDENSRGARSSPSRSPSRRGGRKRDVGKNSFVSCTAEAAAENNVEDEPALNAIETSSDHDQNKIPKSSTRSSRSVRSTRSSRSKSSKGSEISTGKKLRKSKKQKSTGNLLGADGGDDDDEPSVGSVKKKKTKKLTKNSHRSERKLKVDMDDGNDDSSRISTKKKKKSSKKKEGSSSSGGSNPKSKRKLVTKDGEDNAVPSVQ